MAEEHARPQRTGTQGWEQFLTGRKEMLDAYDKARSNAQAHVIATSHGNVAEACFREWLSKLLPRKYGVTSGFIVSQAASDQSKTPHFDVIIYDKLESPVLWVEDDPDRSVAGTSRAIPAEHVCAVLEVKAALTTATAKRRSSIWTNSSLCWQVLMLWTSDTPDSCHPDSSAAAFSSRRDERMWSLAEKALNRLVEPHELRGYNGALILRGEGLEKLVTGRIQLLTSSTPLESNDWRTQRVVLPFTAGRLD